MCGSCWIAYGAPIVRTEEIDEAALLIRRLYQDLGQDMGGPLHELIDDMNIEEVCAPGDMDRYRPVTYDYSQGGKAVLGDGYAYSQDVVDCCERILTLLGDMSVTHRAAAIGWAHGFPHNYWTFVTNSAPAQVVCAPVGS